MMKRKKRLFYHHYLNINLFRSNTCVEFQVATNHQPTQRNLTDAFIITNDVWNVMSLMRQLVADPQTSMFVQDARIAGRNPKKLRPKKKLSRHFHFITKLR